MRALLACVVVVCIALPAAAQTVPRPAAVRAVPVLAAPGAYRGMLAVKVYESAGVVRDPKGPAAWRFSPAAADLAALVGPNGRFAARPLFGTAPADIDALRRRATAAGGKAVPDLTLWMLVDAPASRVAEIATALLATGRVEALQPVYPPVPAVLPGAGALRGPPRPRAAPVTPFSPVPPAPGTCPQGDRRYLQGYLRAAPEGIDAVFARRYPGGRGEGLTIADVELGWALDHTDHPFGDAAFVCGTNGATPEIRHHGTSVLGEMGALEDGCGVEGIAPRATYRVANWDCDNTGAGAIVALINAVGPQGVVLIEGQIQGPEFSECGSNAQSGCVPIEWFEPAYDAIVNGVAAGTHLIVPAGNGGYADGASSNDARGDLDAPLFERKFDRTFRDSGSIVVGASAGADLGRADFSNHGSRCDLSGWGLNVASTGYGDLYDGGGDETLMYTGEFAGTSSASPIVAAAVALVTAVHRERTNGEALAPAAVRTLLNRTGTPTTGNIGPRPDLRAAILDPTPVVPGGAGAPCPYDIAHADAAPCDDAFVCIADFASAVGCNADADCRPSVAARKNPQCVQGRCVASWCAPRCARDREPCAPGTRPTYTDGGDCVCEPCTRDCFQRTCGGDGCGGTCGTCSAGLVCADGNCTGGRASKVGDRCPYDGAAADAPECGPGYFCIGWGVSQQLQSCNAAAECTIFPYTYNNACTQGTCTASFCARRCDPGATCPYPLERYVYPGSGDCICQPCKPSCGDRRCGPDNCGGSCGTCGPGLGCNAEGRCVEGGGDADDADAADEEPGGDTPDPAEPEPELDNSSDVPTDEGADVPGDPDGAPDADDAADAPADAEPESADTESSDAEPVDVTADINDDAPAGDADTERPADSDVLDLEPVDRSERIDSIVIERPSPRRGCSGGTGGAGWIAAAAAAVAFTRRRSAR